MDGDETAFAGAGGVTIAPGDNPFHRVTRHANAGVILLRGVDAIGELVVSTDIVKLGRQLIINRREGGAAVEGDIGATVIALDHALVVARVDPKAVVVTVGRGDGIPVAATVG